MLTNILLSLTLATTGAADYTAAVPKDVIYNETIKNEQEEIHEYVKEIINQKGAEMSYGYRQKVELFGTTVYDINYTVNGVHYWAIININNIPE